MPTPRRDRIDAQGAVLLIGFSLLMGLNQALIKLVNAGMAPVFQAGLRSALAVLPVLIFALITRKKLSVTDGSLGPGLICGGLFALEFVLLFQALDYTSVARTSIFFYTMPFWVALGAHWLIPGERLTSRRLAGLGLAILGVALALSGRDETLGPLAWLGDLMCLLAAICWAVLALIMRVSRFRHASPEMQLLYQLGVSAPVLLVLAPTFGDTFREMTEILWAVFAFQVLVVVSVGFLTWFWVLSVYPAPQMASFSFLAPVFGVLAGWAIFGDPLTPQILAALGLVGAGIFLVNWRGTLGRR
ncbi:MAG: DMT family transporter [Pseudomonadota bacterium]